MGGFGVKPGRSQSALGAIGGVIFGIVCLVMAMFVGSVGAPGLFVLVPVAMALLAFIGSGASLFNAVSKNRMSSFEVVDLDDEPDPLTPGAARRAPPSSDEARRYPGAFCPFCGKPVEPDHNFCPACGGDI